MDTPSRAPLKPIFELNLLSKAAHKNYILLRHKFGDDIKKALLAQQDLPLCYGLEFKLIEMLAQIFGCHPS
jgi:hypothetical protein